MPDKLRAIDYVIGHILKVVPEHETTLRRKLMSIQYSAGYSAPECMGRLWDQLETLLETAIPETTEDWHRCVGVLMRDE